MPSRIAAMTGTIAYSVGQWLLIVLIGRLQSPETLGEYAFALALAAPVFMLGNLRLRFVLASDRQCTPFSHFLKLRIWLACSAALVAASLGAATADSAEGFAIVLAVIAFKTIDAIGDVGIGLFQTMERPTEMATALWSLAVAGVACFGAALSITDSLVIACLTLAAVRMAVLVGYEAPRWHAAEIERVGAERGGDSAPTGLGSATAAQVIALFRRAWTLGGAAVLDSLNTNLPRYFVTVALGKAALGSFAAMTTFAQAVFLVVNSIAQLELPTLARMAGSPTRGGFGWRVARLGLLAAALGASAVCMTWFSGERVLGLVFGAEFVADADAFFPIMLAGLGAVLALVATYALTALGDYRQQVLAYLACTVATYAFCLGVSPSSGLAGFGMAVFMAQLVHVVVAISLFAFLVRRRAR